MTAKFEHFPLTHAPNVVGTETWNTNDVTAAAMSQRMVGSPFCSTCLERPGVDAPWTALSPCSELSIPSERYRMMNPPTHATVKDLRPQAILAGCDASATRSRLDCGERHLSALSSAWLFELGTRDRVCMLEVVIHWLDLPFVFPAGMCEPRFAGVGIRV